jgi:hypothetical protein
VGLGVAAAASVYAQAMDGCPDLEPTEPATLLAAAKTAEADSKALQAKLASVDVGGTLSPAVVQKLAGTVVRARPASSCARRGSRPASSMALAWPRSALSAHSLRCRAPAGASAQGQECADGPVRSSEGSRRHHSSDQGRQAGRCIRKKCPVRVEDTWRYWSDTLRCLLRRASFWDAHMLTCVGTTCRQGFGLCITFQGAS